MAASAARAMATVARLCVWMYKVARGKGESELGFVPGVGGDLLILSRRPVAAAVENPADEGARGRERGDSLRLKTLALVGWAWCCSVLA